MKELDEKESAKLVSLIYGTSMDENWNSLKTHKEDTTVANLIDEMEESVRTYSKDLTRDKEGNIIYGGEMTKEEFLDVIDQIRASDTLMRMEIKNFSDDKTTDFRAMTLEDPKHKVKPTIVFRGTAGDAQWGDNFSALFSSQTPSQKEAVKYVMNSGLDHVTLAGHSKGGNMAASCAYLLPEGMVDKVYSYDGQGASSTFLSQISKGKIKYSMNLIYNINEYRDPVSQIFTKTGSDKNTIYFDSGVDYYNADLMGDGFNLKMYFFHVHKPNYFIYPGVTLADRTFVPSRIANQISMWNGLDDLPESLKLKIAKSVAGVLYTDDSKTEWTDKRWKAVLAAEGIYANVNKSREDELCKCLSELYHVDFSKFKLDQEPTSFVVDGAILACPYCSSTGELKNIEDHGHMIQHKPVASKKDNKAGINIVIEQGQCSSYAVAELEKENETGTIKCKPDICHEWVLTEPDKKLYIDGQKVEAVLKKSVLGCLNGGIITVEHNGQIDAGDIEQLPPKENRRKLTGEEILSGIKIEVESSIKDQIDLRVDLAETLLHGCQGIVDKIQNGIAETGEALNHAFQELEKAKDLYIQNYIWQQVRFK